jgi:hypothetical protein
MQRGKVLLEGFDMAEEEVKKKKATANKEEITHKSSQGVTSTVPDVCKTPSPAGPVPIPYPNIAKSSDTSSGSKKVKVEGKESSLKNKSHYEMSSGDEPSQTSGVIGSIKRAMKVRKLGLPLWVWSLSLVIIILATWIVVSNSSPALTPVEQF